MIAIRVTESILFLYLTVSVTRGARKYNIDDECQKLYSEDLVTVLQRFRNTPDYLTILNSRISEYQTYISDMKNQITYHFLQQQNQKVRQMLGIKKDKDNTRSNLRASNVFAIRNARRAAGAGDNKTKVERLDSYKKLSSALTVAQRNAMRDLGFTYAGNVIHALVKNMGGDNYASTQAAMDAEYDHSSTNHVSVHIVSTKAMEEGYFDMQTRETAEPKGHKDRHKHKDDTDRT